MRFSKTITQHLYAPVIYLNFYHTSCVWIRDYGRRFITVCFKSKSKTKCL